MEFVHIYVLLNVPEYLADVTFFFAEVGCTSQVYSEERMAEL